MWACAGLCESCLQTCRVDQEVETQSWHVSCNSPAGDRAGSEGGVAVTVYCFFHLAFFLFLVILPRATLKSCKLLKASLLKSVFIKRDTLNVCVINVWWFSRSNLSAFLFYLHIYRSAFQITMCLRPDMFKQVVTYPRVGAELLLLKQILMAVVYLV